MKPLSLKTAIRPALAYLLALVSAVMLAPLPAAALTIVPQCARQGNQVPSLNCILTAFTNVAQFILGVTGSFALLMFVYGGFRMVLARGNSDEVSTGKTIIRNAVIGIFIILTAGMLIRYGVGKLTSGSKESMIIGSACTSGKASGQVMEIPSTGEKKCVTTCTELSKDGFSCMESTDGVNCTPGLCHDNPSKTWLCCQPAGGGPSTSN